MHVVWTQQIDQLQHRLAPGARRQLAVALVQRRCDENLLAVGVRASGLGPIRSALLELNIVSRAVGVAGEKDAGHKHEEGAEVREGEDSIVDDAQDGALPSPRRHQVRIGSSLRQRLDAWQAGADGAEP